MYKTAYRDFIIEFLRGFSLQTLDLIREFIWGNVCLFVILANITFDYRVPTTVNIQTLNLTVESLRKVSLQTLDLTIEFLRRVNLQTLDLTTESLLLWLVQALKS